jgi:single-strand DNA-binding protein
MSLNKAMLIGRLGHDPELRNTGGNNPVLNMRVATTTRRKDGDEWVDHTEWHSVTVWGRTAENVVKYCKKGKELYIEGRIQTRKYEDKSGVERYSTEIVAEQVRFLGSRGDSAQSGGSVAPTNGKAHSDGEIPF